LGLGAAASALTMGYVVNRVIHTTSLNLTKKRMLELKPIVKSKSFVDCDLTKDIFQASNDQKTERIIYKETETYLVSADPEAYSSLLKGQLIGLDCEWYKDGKVALLQLADAHGTCLLIRLNLLKAIPDFVAEIMQSKSVVKVGVNIKEDAAKLKRDYGVGTEGWVDIRHLAKRFRPNQKRLGLAGLAQEFLDVKLDKDWRVSASNWEKETLSNKQVLYSANDAFAGVGCVMAMAMEHMATNKATLFPGNITYDDVIGEAVSLCKPFANIRFSDKNGSAAANSKGNSKEKSNGSGGGGKAGGSNQGDTITKRQAFSTRKSPLYNNAKLEAPDGQQLCVTDAGKAAWYVGKGLGHYVSQDPVVVRLHFEPAGRPEGEAGQYYLTEKTNRCVVCGKDDSYLRKYIVPHEYRKHFPEIMRDHQSHDVLLFCIECHQRGNCFDLSLRQKLALECDAPIGTEEDVKVKEDVELKQVRSAGRALINDKGHKIPDERIQQLEKVLRDYYGVDQVTRDVMRKGADLETNILNDNYVPHGKKVVEHFMKEKGIIALEVMWRQHFLDTMNPQCLPPKWSVDHQKERLDIKAAENRIDPNDYALAVGQQQQA